MDSVCSRRRLPSTSRMMFTRVAPLRLKFSLIGSRTLVARTISSLTPFKALPTRVSLSPRLYTSAVSMKLIPLSRASFTMRVVSSWPRLPMFILPPNCIVPSATLLTMSPVFPSLLYFISHSFCYKRRLRSRYSPQFTSGNWLSPCLGAQCHRTWDQSRALVQCHVQFARHFDRHLREVRVFTSLASSCFQVCERRSSSSFFLAVTL